MTLMNGLAWLFVIALGTIVAIAILTALWGVLMAPLTLIEDALDRTAFGRWLDARRTQGSSIGTASPYHGMSMQEYWNWARQQEDEQQ